LGSRRRGLIEVPNGTAAIALLPIGVAAGDEGVGVVWIDPERLIIIMNRLIDAALVRARASAAIESLYACTSSNFPVAPCRAGRQTPNRIIQTIIDRTRAVPPSAQRGLM